MDRRRFLKVLGTATAAAAAGVFLGGSEIGCEAGGGAKNEDKPKGRKAPPFQTGHPGRPLRPTHDDGRRYICKWPSHRSPGLVIFGTEAMLQHRARYPRHRPYIRPY